MIVSTVLRCASLSYLFFSFDLKFGQNYMYVTMMMCVVNLAREIRDNSLYVRDFDLFELNAIVRDFTT